MEELKKLVSAVSVQYVGTAEEGEVLADFLRRRQAELRSIICSLWPELLRMQAEFRG